MHGTNRSYASGCKCPECRAAHAACLREWRDRDPERAKTYQRDWHRQRRETVLEHYGGRCACCGEDSYEFLALDHANGGGEQHRAEVGQGSNMIAWIIDNDFPEGFRILCHNCNQAIGYYGACPHERALRLVVGDE
jgi:hypothetical protein